MKRHNLSKDSDSTLISRSPIPQSTIPKRLQHTHILDGGPMVGVFFFLGSQNDCRSPWGHPFPPYPAGASMLAPALPSTGPGCILIGHNQFGSHSPPPAPPPNQSPWPLDWNVLTGSAPVTGSTPEGGRGQSLETNTLHKGIQRCFTKKGSRGCWRQNH